MLDEYRIEPMTVGQYLDSIVEEDIKTDQAVQRDFCWKPEMMNGLIYSVLSRRIYVPNIILAEERSENGSKQTYVVDGGHRTETLKRFRQNDYKVSKNIRNYLIPYNKKLSNEDGYIRNEYGDIQYEVVEFDIRNKTYNDLPQELKNKFNGCPIQTAIYQDCTPEEISELVLLMNNHVSMNPSQKSLTYIGRFANDIKRIKDTNRFLIDCTELTENEKSKGVWERVISESVMAVYHFDNWKKNPKDMCDYLNNNSSYEELKKIEDYYNRLIPFSDKLENKEIASLFTSKNIFVWLMLFDKFNKLNISDEKFGEFLRSFVVKLHNTDVGGDTWESIDSNKNTKDRTLIVKKVGCLEKLMMDFLHIDEKNIVEPNEELTVVDFVKENVDSSITEEYIADYEEDLAILTLEVDNTSKLLERQNHNSLIAIIAYTYKHDLILDKWFVEFFKNNNTYDLNQKKNFTYMRDSLEEFIQFEDREVI